MQSDTTLGFNSINSLLKQAAQKKSIFAFVFLLSLLISSAAILSLTPEYRATALLLLPTSRVDDPRDATNEALSTPSDPFMMQGEIDVLTSPEVAGRVIDKLGLANNPEFAEHPLDTYFDMLSVYNSGRSNSARVSFTSSDPRLAADVANAHVQAYIDFQSDRRFQARARVVDLLTQELERQRLGNGSATVEPGDDAARVVLDRSVADRETAAVSRLQIRLSDAQRALSDGALQTADYVASDAKMISAAMVPTSKIFPKTVLFMLVAGLLSLIAGMTAAIAASYADNRALRRDAFLRSMGLRRLALLPAVPKGRRRRAHAQTVFWEQLRLARDLVVASAKMPSRLFLVTSAMPDEGKSLVATSLAQAFAAAGRRTLLVDADFRDAAISKALIASGELKKAGGMSEVLASGQEVGPLLQSLDANLDVLLAGDIARPVDSLASDRLRPMIERLRAAYEIVILDGAPLGVVSDALPIVALADETIVVCSGTRSEQAAILDLVTILRDVGARIGGFVLTGVKARLIGSLSRRDRMLLSVGHLPAPSTDGPKARPSLAATAGAASKRIEGVEA